MAAYLNNQIEVLKNSKQLENGKLELAKPFLQKNKHVDRMFLRTFPQSSIDKMLQPDFTIDVWLDKNKPFTQGKSLYEFPEGRVCVVLGGGNVYVSLIF